MTVAVYFIQNTTTRSIKIGWTNNLPKRLNALQTASEHELVLLCSVAGGRTLERALHVSLAEHRIRGEWFSNSPEVARVVGELIASELTRTGALAGAPLAQQGRQVVARDWLIERFRERPYWASGDLFNRARQDRVSRDAVFEAKSQLGLPRPRKVTLENGNVEWRWWVPADWPHLRADGKEVAS